MDNTKLARISGILYLLIIPFAIYGMIYVPEMVYTNQEISQVINNVANYQLDITLATLANFVGQMLNIVLSICLFLLLRQHSSIAALMMLILFIVSVPITLIGELAHWVVINKLMTGQIIEQQFMLLVIEIRQAIEVFAQYFWGLWLLPLAYLISLTAQKLNKLVAVLIALAGLGYVVDSTLAVLGINIGFVFSEITFIGELTFILWLLFVFRKEHSAD